jgi:N-acetylglucosaminyl-diphospho-decaprenol L-rhamnosyltransferase
MAGMKPKVSIIIVTHNSQSVLPLCLEALGRQTVTPGQVIVVDSGSNDTSYLEKAAQNIHCTFLTFSNIGFAAANNRGLELVDDTCDYILIINPDTLLLPTTIEKSLEVMTTATDAAVLTGVLEGYDPVCLAATGKIDSTGIFRTWYGRWHDRGQGKKNSTVYPKRQYVPAACGAFMFFRYTAIKNELPELFDESFFMYKEDIELCLRIAKNGWKIYYSPEIKAYHCRGWNTDRRSMSRSRRIMSARNEIWLYHRHPSAYIIWAWLKYALVKYLNV